MSIDKTIYDCLMIKSNQWLFGCESNFKESESGFYCTHTSCCISHGRTYCKLNKYEQSQPK